MDWGGLISGVGSAVGSVISGAVSKSQMDNQFEMQKRDQDFQREMWQKTNEYNSPKNQARLMAQGGFSPSALFGQNGSSISQAQQASGGSHGYTPVMPEAISNPFLGITSIAQAMSSLANAKKQGAETTTIQQMLEHQLRGMQLDNNMKELNNALISAYGDKKASAEVGKLVAEIANLSSQTQFTNEKSKSETIKQVGYAIDNLIKNVEHDLKGEELRQIRIFLKSYERRLTLEMANIQSETSLNEERVNTEKSIQGLNNVLKELREVEKDSAKDMSPVKLKQEFAKLDAIQTATLLEKLRAEDMAAYSAFQRILTGHSQDGDVTKIINAIHNIDNVSTVLPKITK